MKKVGVPIWVSSLISLTKLTNLVWALLQGIKWLLGTHGFEDLLYTSTIRELMQLRIVKKIQTSTNGSTQQPMVD